jgi:hypothetical protein
MATATFDDIVREASPKSRTVVCGALVTDSYVQDGTIYVRSLEGVFVPGSAVGMENISNYLEETYERKLMALENADFYRMAIIDESIPASYGECCGLLLNHDVYFCRQDMIKMLGEIGYDPACPEIREAMLHDLRVEIREAATEALGKIGDKNYTKDLVRLATDEGNPVSHTALMALGDMKDESTLPLLEDMLNEGIRNYYRGCLFDDRDLVWKGMNDIWRMTRVLRKFGGKANDIIKETAKHYEFAIRWSVGKGIEYSRLD